MKTTIKCRLPPTFEQQDKLEQTLDGCRWVYNYFRKKQLSLEDMKFAFVELKESHSWIRNYQRKMLQMVVYQIDAASSALDARAMLHTGFGYLKQMLQYKTKIVVEVNPAYTSIECSRCHEKVPKSLAVMTHRCTRCGLVLDRDHNSSINIEQRGRVLLCLPARADLPQGLREVTPVELQWEYLKPEEAIGLV